MDSWSNKIGATSFRGQRGSSSYQLEPPINVSNESRLWRLDSRCKVSIVDVLVRCPRSFLSRPERSGDTHEPSP